MKTLLTISLCCCALNALQANGRFYFVVINGKTFTVWQNGHNIEVTDPNGNRRVGTVWDSPSNSNSDCEPVQISPED